jgi:hypothetical protein
MEINKIKNDEKILAPCFAINYPENKHLNAGWIKCIPGVFGLIVEINSQECFCSGGIITRDQLKETGYIDIDVIFEVLNKLKIKDLRDICKALGLINTGKKKDLINTIIINLKGENED